MELNREQIIKALECCGEYTHGTTCKNCPYMYIELADNEICSNRMAQDALSLIKELTEENERLTERLEDTEKIAEFYRKEAEQALERRKK